MFAFPVAFVEGYTYRIIVSVVGIPTVEFVPTIDLFRVDPSLLRKSAQNIPTDPVPPQIIVGRRDAAKSDQKNQDRGQGE